MNKIRSPSLVLFSGYQPKATMRTMHIVMSDSAKPLQFMSYTGGWHPYGGKWVYGRKGNDQISKFNCVSDKTGPECH